MRLCCVPNLKHEADMKNKLRFYGLADDYARFIEQEQLLDESLWKKFVRVFPDCADVADEGWRSEYWGKMMRGACMTYSYTRNEALYTVLETAVKNLLSVQDEYGRFSSYDIEHEFHGWDIWGRKYVLVGLEYFYDICRDVALKTKIVGAMCRHADYLVQKIGTEKGQIAITETSEWWGGVNSCSILEPIVTLYRLTDTPEYLSFAEYIISTGGCRNADLIELVAQGKKPFEFPVTKAYELMSFFEGLLAYYETTKKKKYLDTVVKFAQAVIESDITIIGCAGCTHELFDHSAEKQTEYSETIMQETCVTVTWMRLLARLWENTHNARYLDYIEQSALNALYGSINTGRLKMFSFEKQKEVPPLPFDSYSPLYNNVRGRGVGGFKEFAQGGNYGCCACIGAAGTALYPLYAFVGGENTVYCNFFLNGAAEIILDGGYKVRVECVSEYPADGNIKLIVHIEQAEKFTLAVHIPRWCEKATVTCGGKTFPAKNGYARLEKEWNDGDEVVLSFPIDLQKIVLNGKTAFTYGALVLARDEEKENGDITERIVLEENELLYKRVAPVRGEQLRLKLKTKNGDILLTDYASCGKNWASSRNRITVWTNVN